MKPQDEYFDLSFLKPDVGCAELTEKLKDYDKLQCYIWGCKLSQGTKLESFLDSVLSGTLLVDIQTFWPEMQLAAVV